MYLARAKTDRAGPQAFDSVTRVIHVKVLYSFSTRIGGVILGSEYESAVCRIIKSTCRNGCGAHSRRSHLIAPDGSRLCCIGTSRLTFNGDGHSYRFACECLLPSRMAAASLRGARMAHAGSGARRSVGPGKGTLGLLLL